MGLRAGDINGSSLHIDGNLSYGWGMESRQWSKKRRGCLEKLKHLRLGREKEGIKNNKNKSSEVGGKS